MDKKGIVFTRPRDTVSFFIGLILFALGLIPLIGPSPGFGFIGFGLPAFITNLIASIFIWIIAVAGLYIVIDGFVEPPAHNLHWFLIIGGVVLFVVGLLPILHKYEVIGFGLDFLNNLLVYQGLIALEGLFLMVGGLTEH